MVSFVDVWLCNCNQVDDLHGQRGSHNCVCLGWRERAHGVNCWHVCVCLCVLVCVCVWLCVFDLYSSVGVCWSHVICHFASVCCCGHMFIIRSRSRVLAIVSTTSYEQSMSGVYVRCGWHRTGTRTSDGSTSWRVPLDPRAGTARCKCQTNVIVTLMYK